MINRLHFMTIALTGAALAASAYVFRSYSRSQIARQHKTDVSTWEGEGGKPAPAAASYSPPGPRT